MWTTIDRAIPGRSAAGRRNPERRSAAVVTRRVLRGGWATSEEKVVFGIGALCAAAAG